MRESAVEKHLIKEVKKLRGLCKKWVCPGWNGAPDRIVLLPGARLWFVEVKRPGEKPRAKQAYRLEQLRALGFNALYLDSIEEVDKFIERIITDDK